jgi:hypothetical protein
MGIGMGMGIGGGAVATNSGWSIDPVTAGLVIGFSGDLTEPAFSAGLKVAVVLF